MLAYKVGAKCVFVWERKSKIFHMHKPLYQENMTGETNQRRQIIFEALFMFYPWYIVQGKFA